MNPFRSALDAAAATTQLARDACGALWMLLAPRDSWPDGERPLVGYIDELAANG